MQLATHSLTWLRDPTLPKVTASQGKGPLVLRIIPHFTLFWGYSVVLTFLLAPFFTYNLNGRIVSGREFISQTGIPLVILGIMGFAISYSLWRGAIWSRPLMLTALLFLLCARGWIGFKEVPDLTTGLVDFFLDLGNLSLIIGLLLGVWYLYLKSNVRDYYRSLANPVYDAAKEFE